MAEYLSDEIRHLSRSIKQDTPNAVAFNRVMHKTQKKDMKRKQIGAGTLRSQQSTSCKNDKLLEKFNVKVFHLPAKRSSHILIPVEDELRLNVFGVYNILCECSKLSIGQTTGIHSKNMQIS
jgi:hypothetical protein